MKDIDLDLENKEIREYYRFKIKNLKENTQRLKIYYLGEFLDVINYKKAQDLTKDEIYQFLYESEFSELANTTKNTRLTTVKQFLTFVEREDLRELIPKYNEGDHEIDKTKLINRNDLAKLLNLCKNIRERTLLMLMFESAARRDEIVNIKWEDIEIKDEYIKLYLGESKTTKRNISLVETLPFMQEYLQTCEVKLKPKSRLFGYTSNDSIYKFIERLEKRAKKIKFEKHIYPHLFRHSRLTELARNRKLNEPQLRRFAGWSKNSDMPARYFHIDDSDLRDVLLEEQGIKTKNQKEEKLKFKAIRCPQCTNINNRFNQFCWKCGAILENSMEQDEDLQNQLQELQKLVFELIEDKERRTQKLKELEKEL